MKNSKHLSFIEHLAELRSRILRLLVIYALTFCACYYFSDELYYVIAKPLIEILGDKTHFIYTNLAEGFFTQINLAAKFAFLIILPVIAFQIYFFIEPGLYKSERKLIKLLIISSPLLFFLGVIFVYFFVMPKAFEFFISFQKTGLPYNLSLEAKINEYVSLVISLVFAFGIAFQLPVIILILVSLKLIKAESLRLYRRFAILAIFIIAGIITPPDVISQLLLAFPLMGLYELTIIIAKNIESRRENA